MGGVPGLEIGQGGVYEGFIGPKIIRQGLGHEVAYAVAHHPAVLRLAVQRESPERKGVVHGVAQVFDGVDEGPVQVEEDQSVT